MDIALFDWLLTLNMLIGWCLLIMDQECDRALHRIDNEQEKMRLFHEDVRCKFSDLIKSELLFDDDYGDGEDELSRTKTLTNGPVQF